jgi:SET and MYND domain-containing protein
MTIPQSTNIHISDLFEVLQTQYGRACFASQEISKGTELLLTNSGFGSTILYEFRKEVCSNCFRYEYGKYWKLKVPVPRGHKKFLGAGLWFCSEECLICWREFDPEEKLTMAYETLLVNYQMKVKAKHDKEDNDVVITREVIEEAWRGIKDWEGKVSKMKKSKQSNQLPVLNEEEYVSARFMTLVLHNLYIGHPSSQLFEHLQSNELEKITIFPVLLKSQTQVYKFLRLLLPEYLQPLLTPEFLRITFGREYGNAFGIRQVTEEGSSEEKELLGYMISPEASFFNHSCRPNLKKERRENRMLFVATADIKQGEQLCIDYFQISEEKFDYRQKTLNENWFFQCECDRCNEERGQN